MDPATALLRLVIETLDGLGIAACVFHAADGMPQWNRSFLSVFPEHADPVPAGESSGIGGVRIFGADGRSDKA